MTQIIKPNQNLKQLTLFDLEKLEKNVTEGLAKFIEVGQALAEIRDRDAFRLRGHRTFEEYCEKQFGFSLRQGQRLIAAAETAETVKKITGEAPRNEAAARVLSGIAGDEKTVKSVAAELKKGKKTFATATAEKIQEVVDRLKGKAPSAAPKVDPVETQPTEPPRVYVMPTPIVDTRDICPHCNEVPPSYQHSESGWLCGNCQRAVFIKVAVPTEAKHCPSCRAILNAQDDFCGSCGEVLP